MYENNVRHAVPSSRHRSSIRSSPRQIPGSPRQRGARFIRVVGVVVAALCLAAIAAVMLLSTTNTARLVPVLSNSMAPGMSIGSLAVTVPTPRSDIRVGDVIVFIDPDHPTIRIIHRIVHIYGADEASKFTNWKADELTASTKGDNNPTADPWTVTISAPIIWRMVYSAPHLGEPAIWFQTPTIRLWGFGTVGAGLVIWALVLVWRRPTPVTVEK